jgi:hypothetical protein
MSKPVPCMDMGSGQFARRRMPQIRFLYIGWCACFTLTPDPASRWCRCASLSLHIHQVVKRTFTFELSSMLGTHKETRVSGPRGFVIGQEEE